MHAKSGLRVVLKWKIFRPDSVIAAVLAIGAFTRLMVDPPNPYEPTESQSEALPKLRRGSIFATWIGFYLIAATILLLTMPATSHSPSGHGILIAFAVLMFGAFRMARVGARRSTAFIYGCSTTPLFLFRFLTMGRFSLWLEHQAPPIPMIVVGWIFLCLMLGFLAMCAAIAAHEGAKPIGNSTG